MGGIFGDLFDFNGDGKLDTLEQAMEFEFLEKMVQEEELDTVGLDSDELEFMDEDERREAIEDAGLDPDEYDF